MKSSLKSSAVHAQIDELLLSGKAQTAYEAEEMFLDAHLEELAQLALDLDEESFKNHEAVKLLFAHGSRPLEDSLD